MRREVCLHIVLPLVTCCSGLRTIVCSFTSAGCRGLDGAVKRFVHTRQTSETSEVVTLGAVANCGKIARYLGQLSICLRTEVVMHLWHYATYSGQTWSTAQVLKWRASVTGLEASAFSLTFQPSPVLVALPNRYIKDNHGVPGLKTILNLDATHRQLSSQEHEARRHPPPVYCWRDGSSY